MKKYKFIYLFFCSMVLFASTKNKIEPVAEQIDLKDNNSFRNYVARDIVRKLDLLTYTNQQISFEKRAMFLQDMSTLNAHSQDNVESIY